MKRKIVFFFLFFLFGVFTVNSISSDYVYNTLSKKEKKLYNKIGRAVMSCSEEIDVTDFTKEDCLRVYSDYLDDHPGVFWADNSIRYTTYKDKKGKIFHSMFFSYTHRKTLSKDKKTFINLVEYFHKHIKDDENDWIKLFHIYEYLALTIVYDNSYSDQSMWSVFFNGVGVCAGFARSFQYLALLEGIPCLIVTGYEKSHSEEAVKTKHAWCMAEINGKWYHFDPTWGIKDGNGNVDYTYFCRSTEKIEKTHIIDNSYPLPLALDDSLSYVSIRKRYLEKYSLEDVKEIARKAFERNESLFTIEFSSAKESDRAFDELVQKKQIYKVLANLGKQVGSFLYKYNRSNNTLTFSLKD